MASRFRARRVRLGAIIAIGIAVGLVVWIVLDRTGGEPAPKQPNAVLVSPSGLLTIVRAVRHPIYWVGTRNNVKYELTQTGDGNIYVRYLPATEKAGANQRYLTVGTYPVVNAYEATASAASAPGATRLRVGPGAIAFSSRSAPTSVYLAYRGIDYQIEVFAPAPGAAQALVRAHGVVAVGASAPPTPLSALKVTPLALATLAKNLDHPLYWAGRRSGVTYELSQTTEGRIYIRYLPEGVPLGSRQPFLTIGTYPLTDAYQSTLKAAEEANATRLTVPGDVVAFYSSLRPQSVYFAERGGSVQIEVYDPKPAVARRIVKSGRLRPIE